MASKVRKSATLAAGKRPSQAAGLRRTTRSGLKTTAKNTAEEACSESESQEDNEDDNSASEGEQENDTSEEPEAFAPSGATRHRRGHQTGLSLELSKTDISGANGRKRALSASSNESYAARPIKRTKKKDIETDWKNDLTNDEGYDAVDEISESEAEDDAVEEIETSFIKDEFGVVDEDYLQDSAFEEQYARTELNGSRDFFSLGNNGNGTVSAPEETPTRRVRFAGIDSSTSTSPSTSEFEETFPDLITDDLGYSRQEISIPDEDDEEQSSDGYWDLNPNNPFAEEDRMLAKHGFIEAEESESSGYLTDSDDGTTTEEEPEPLHSVSLPKKMLELRSDSPQPDGWKPRRLAMPRTRPTALAKGKGPVMGTWTADPSKPIAVIGKGVIKFYHVPSQTFGTQESLSSSPHSSPQRSFVPLARPASAGDISQIGQCLDSQTSFGSMANSDILSSEAFLPMELEEAALYAEFDDDDDDVSDTLDINDLIDFGDDSTDDDNDKSDSEVPQTPAKQFPTAKLPKITPKQSSDRPSSHNLLEHFDRGVVSAFRRNQHRAQYQYGRWQPSSLLAIKGGRHYSANNPISPLRKRKATATLSPTSPIQGINKRRHIPPATRTRQNTL